PLSLLRLGYVAHRGGPLGGEPCRRALARAIRVRALGALRRGREGSLRTAAGGGSGGARSRAATADRPGHLRRSPRARAFGGEARLPSAHPRSGARSRRHPFGGRCGRGQSAVRQTPRAPRRARARPGLLGGSSPERPRFVSARRGAADGAHATPARAAAARLQWGSAVCRSQLGAPPLRGARLAPKKAHGSGGTKPVYVQRAGAGSDLENAPVCQSTNSVPSAVPAPTSAI